MKKLIYIGIMAGSLLLNSSCSDWLDLLPKNEQVIDAYWKSKEDVEAVIASRLLLYAFLLPIIAEMGRSCESIYLYLDR